MGRFCLLLIPFLIGCSTDKEMPVQEDNEPLLDGILSCSVAFSHTDAKVKTFFDAPSLAYVSGYFYFEDNLADDIIFGLDIELLEGLENPNRFEGADWMALAGFDRTGRLWFPIGSPENLEGTPTTTDNWVIKDFGMALRPNIWYKMTITCDFEALEFVSVRLQSDGEDQELALDGYPLEYPNYMPFDKATLTGYTFALRGKEFAPENQGGFNVYFDDVEMGIQTSGNSFEVIFTDGFENQSTVEEIPITSIPIALESIPENRWYLENEDAKLFIDNDIVRTGDNSLRCSADLRE